MNAINTHISEPCCETRNQTFGGRLANCVLQTHSTKGHSKIIYDWPTLGSAPKFVMRPDPTPLKQPAKKARIVEVSPQRLNEEEFPTFDDKAPVGPTIFDQLKAPSGGVKKGKGKITNVQPKPKTNVNLQAMNVANFNNLQKQKEKEPKEEFPGLGQGAAKGLLVNIPEATAFEEPELKEDEGWSKAPEPKAKKQSKPMAAAKKPISDEEDFPKMEEDKGDFPPPSMATSFGRMTAQERLNNNLKGVLKEAEKAGQQEAQEKKGKVFKLSDMEKVKGEQIKAVQLKKDFEEVEGFDEEESKGKKGEKVDKNKRTQQVFEENLRTLERVVSGKTEGGDFPTLGGPVVQPKVVGKQMDIRTAVILENSDLTIVKKKSKKK